jgi:pilus assembly protein CpaC
MREDTMISLSLPIRASRPAKWRLALTLAAALCLATPFAASAAEPSYLKVANRAMGSTQSVSLEVNKSIIVDLPTNVGEVIASAPAVAAVVMRSKTRAIVQGVANGDTNVFFLDPAGNSIAVLDIKVVQTASNVGGSLEATLARVIPGSNIRVATLSDNAVDGKTYYVLTGTVQTAQDKAVAEQLASDLSQSADTEGKGSLIQVIGGQQVKLKVTVAEVGRDTVKQLGINLDGSITVNALSLGLQNSPALGGASGITNGNGVSVGIDAGLFKLNASLKALERRGALRTLAEPTLTAMSGQEASFLAGGEFPVPTDVSQDGKVSYAFKEFGVKLKFTPTVKSNGVISLVLDTSVSELTTEGGISAGTVTIPATKNRQATTTVEMPAGQTLAIAGMLQDSVRQQVNSLPGLGNIPILGALFRSRDFLHSQTELVILVTPYLVSPTVAEPVKPTDNFHVAGDAEAIFLGHMEQMYGVGSDGMRGSYTGSVGFVLD